jgi:hypothetical protein
MLASSAVSAETVTWNNIGDGFWNTSANWTPAKVPAPGDDVVINSAVTGTITVDSEAHIKTLTLSGGHKIALSSHALLINNALTSNATRVFYSVGQNTDDHKTGTPTITISGGIATFSIAQTSANMGVGDRVTYGGSSVAYISAKISATQWALVTATGGTPAPVGQTVDTIAHEYTSLSAAITGASDGNHLNTTNLAAGNYILNIPCYYDSGPDTAPVAVTGYTTGSSNYIKIYTPNNISTEVNQSQRHSGVWTTNRYRMEISGAGARALTISQNYSSIEGLQIGLFGADGGVNVWGINADSTVDTDSITGVKISHCIIKDEQTGTAELHRGISMILWPGQTGTGYIWDNIVYGFRIGYGQGVNAPAPSSANIYVSNNTVYDCKKAFDTFYETTGTILKNNIAQQCDVGFPSFNNALSDYNISNHADAPGANSKNSATVIFVNAAGKNFHLSPSDTAAINAGVDLSGDPNLPFNTDIDGQTRTGLWDIGADEYVP